MATDTNKALAAAKAALSKANNFSRSVGGPAPAPPKTAAAAPAAVPAHSPGIRGEAEDVAAGLKAKTEMAGFKKGGLVPYTGSYKLHKGEGVVTSARMQRAKKALTRKG